MSDSTAMHPREVRVRVLKMSAAALASKLGVSQPHLSRLERGIRAWTLDLAERWRKIVFRKLERDPSIPASMWGSIPEASDFVRWNRANWRKGVYGKDLGRPLRQSKARKGTR